MAFTVVSQIAVQIVADDIQLSKDLDRAEQSVKKWAARKFNAPALRVNTTPAEQSVKRMTSVVVQQAKQSGQVASQLARNQASLAVISARQASQLRRQDTQETEMAERQKVRTKGTADRESLRTRIVSLRTETAEARIQAAAQVKIAKETARQREQIYKTIDRTGKAAGNIGQSLTYGVSLPLVALGKAALDADVRMDSLKRGLVAVNGSAAAANVQFEKLRQVAKLPGLTLEQAVQGDVQLQAAGLSAEQSTRALMAFGNALATVGKTGPEHLGLVNLALSQIASSSRVSGQDVRQLQEQIPQLRQAMLKVFGTADTIQLGKMGIDPKVFVQKITDELAKLPQVTGGIQNDIENAEDKINISLGRIGGAIARVGAGPLEHFTDEVDHVTTAFSHLSTEGQDALIKVAVGVAVGGPLLIGIGRVAEAITSVRSLYLSLPAVAAKSAAAQAASAEGAAVAEAAAAGEVAAASKAAGVSTLAMWGPAGLVMAALALLGVELVALAGKWDDMKKAQNQAAQSARNYADALNSVKGQGERQALGAINQQIGQEIADLKGALSAYKDAQKSGAPNPLGAYRLYLRETPEGNRYDLGNPNYNNPNFGQRRLDALTRDQAKNAARLGAIQQAGLPVGIDGGTDQGAAAASAAMRLQLNGDAKAFVHHCEALARTAQQNAKTAYGAIMQGAGSAAIALARFQARGLAQPYRPGMPLAPGGLLYSTSMGGADGHVQTIGPNGERLDQYGKNHFKLSNFQYYVPPAGTRPGATPTPTVAPDLSSQQNLRRQYIEATQGKYAGERYQAGLDYQANKKIDPKQAAAVYLKALADIHKEELDALKASNKKIETEAERSHRKRLAAATKYLNDLLRTYDKWEKDSLKLRHANIRGTVSTLVGRATAAEPTMQADVVTPEAVRLGTLQQQLTAALAKAQNENDVAHGRIPKALSGAAATRQKYGDLGPLAADQIDQLVNTQADTSQTNAANAKAKKDTEDLTALQKQLRDALADSQDAYDKSTGHVNRYDDIIARLNLDLKTMTPAERDAANAMLPQIAAVDAATAKMRQYHEMLQQIQGGLQSSLANTFEKIMSGAKVTVKSVVDDFKGMFIRIIAENEAAKLAAYVTGKNGIGGLISKPKGPPATPQPEGTGDATGGVLGLVGMALPAYLAMRGGGQAGAANQAAVPGFAATPGFAPGGAGGSGWLGTAAAIAPAFGPQGAAIGAGIGILGSLFGKKSPAATTSAVPGMPGGMGQGVVPVYVVGIAGATGGGLPGQPGGGGVGGLGSILGIASSFIPGGGLLGGIGKGIGHLFHFASGTPSVPGLGAADNVPAYLTPGEMVLSRGMLNGSMPAPVLPAPLLLRQLPSAGHAPLVSAFTEALANTQGVRSGDITVNNTIGTVSHEADENRILDGFGRKLEQLIVTK